MAKQRVEIDVDVPEGFEIDGEPFPIKGENMVGFYVMFKPAFVENARPVSATVEATHPSSQESESK
jgi:hypothetical protein